MGIGLSRKIRSLRKNILFKIKVKNIYLYKFLILIGAFFKFIIKINKNKNYTKYSKDLDKINKFEYSITSQNNEDGIINHILSKINVSKINFIEIGFHYFENNSLALLKKTKKGLFIDGDYWQIYLLKYISKVIYPSKNIYFAHIFVNKNNINSIISKTFLHNEEIDFLSIDIDGLDYYLLQALKLSPKIICVEYNFWYGKEVNCSVPYDENFRWEPGTLYSGASLLALNNLLNSKGYSLIATESACVNAFFIRDDFKDKFEILDPIKNFKEPAKYNKSDLERARKNLLQMKLTYF